MQIEKTTDYPYSLLLLADPEQEKIDGYIHTSDCYIAKEEGEIKGVIVIQKQENQTAEVMNLAVSENHQRKGIARKLLRYISEVWLSELQIKRLLVRTGTSSAGPLMLYQQEGFNLIDVDYDYFVRNYKEPIFENGIQCRHQLILEKVQPISRGYKY